MTTSSRGLHALAFFVAVLPGAAVAQEPESKSAPLAVELTKLLDQTKLDSIAAPRGVEKDQFVGALYLPGSQLLVVGAKFAAPDRMAYLLREKSYRDAYVDLNSASERQTKVFISDLGADGLQFEPEENGPSDTVDLPDRSVAFDGDWRRANMSEADYRKAYEATDQQYAEMLQSLISALKKPS